MIKSAKKLLKVLIISFRLQLAPSPPSSMLLDNCRTSSAISGGSSGSVDSPSVLRFRSALMYGSSRMPPVSSTLDVKSEEDSLPKSGSPSSEQLGRLLFDSDERSSVGRPCDVLELVPSRQ
uniref:(northern house mosquito) hypothetical protein n=1 Tax=Culex pipiens TaxID=7175 RepID=A0A8D8CHQ6_CULPI